MLGTMFNSSTLSVLEQTVNFTEARHGVLAGNMANLDTPGYRARDLSPEEFQERLKEAVEQSRRTTGGRAAYPNSPGLQHAATRENVQQRLAAVTDSMKGILRHDDNNTSLEEQVSEIAKNQAQHNMALSLMTAQFRLLRAAITERA